MTLAHTCQTVINAARDWHTDIGFPSVSNDDNI